MKNIIIILILILVSSCKKDIGNVTLIDNTSINSNDLLSIILDSITITNTQKDDIWKGMNIAVNGSIDILDKNGVETIFLTPSFPRNPAPITHLPTILLIKNNNKFIVSNYYNNVTMGMGGRDVEKFGNDGYVWGDTGEEPSNINPANFPYGNIWVATNIVNGDAKFTKVNQDLSFYHSVYSGDLNHDGKNDIVAIHMGTRGLITTRIHTFINDGNNNFKQQIVIVPTGETGCAYREQAGNSEPGGCPSWSSGSIIMGDVNGDGYPEIIKGDHEHTNGDIVQHSIEVYTDSNHDGRYKRLDFHPLMGKWSENYGAARLKLYDYDNDGDVDLFVKFEKQLPDGSAVGAFQIFNNDGHGIFTGPNYTIDLPQSKFLPAEFDLIDVDNDGDLDIVFNAMKNLHTSDSLIYGFGGDGTTNWNNSATINFDQLIYINNKGIFNQCNKGFIKNFTNGSGILWIKGFKINNQFKFLCLQNTGNYIRTDSNWDPNTWRTTLIEVYPKFY
jgi:hypothetical protein